MSYDEKDRLTDHEECPRCHGLGYRTVTGEPNLAYPCGCRDAEPEPKKDPVMMEEHDVDLLLDIDDVLDNYLGYRTVTGEPNLAYPCGCQEVEAEEDAADVAIQLDEAHDLLWEVYDALDRYADVEDRDGPYGITQVPNAAMRLRQDIHELLNKHGVKVDW